MLTVSARQYTLGIHAGGTRQRRASLGRRDLETGREGALEDCDARRLSRSVAERIVSVCGRLEESKFKAQGKEKQSWEPATTKRVRGVLGRDARLGAKLRDGPLWTGFAQEHHEEGKTETHDVTKAEMGELHSQSHLAARARETPGSADASSGQHSDGRRLGTL